MKLPKYSIGVGDRFGMEARAQLAACVRALQAGVEVAPVWNKSHREHGIVGSRPASVRAAADAAVAALGWRGAYFCDADHVRLATVDGYGAACDFFTLDVAEEIGRPAPEASLDSFVGKHAELAGRIELPGVAPFMVAEGFVRETARKYLAAVEEAGRIYRRVAELREDFVAEISMDETDTAQTPAELLVILAAVADTGIPIQTIAPKFSGRFNKGVDYVGDLGQFSREFAEDLAAVSWAVKTYGLPDNLKLSVHSGSDKFSLYEPMRAAALRAEAGLHLKTAGTTWLEELGGLAEAGGAGLALAQEIYAQAWTRRVELCGPYLSVIDIDADALPAPSFAAKWSSDEYVRALRGNASVRQLLHVGYKVAAEMGRRYLELVAEHQELIGARVTENLYDRHLAPLFVGAPAA